MVIKNKYKHNEWKNNKDFFILKYSRYFNNDLYIYECGFYILVDWYDEYINYKSYDIKKFIFNKIKELDIQIYLLNNNLIIKDISDISLYSTFDNEITKMQTQSFETKHYYNISKLILPEYIENKYFFYYWINLHSSFI